VFIENLGAIGIDKIRDMLNCMRRITVPS